MNFFGMKKEKSNTQQQQTNFSVEELDEMIEAVLEFLDRQEGRK